MVQVFYNLLLLCSFLFRARTGIVSRWQPSPKLPIVNLAVVLISGQSKHWRVWNSYLLGLMRINWQNWLEMSLTKGNFNSLPLCVRQKSNNPRITRPVSTSCVPVLLLMTIYLFWHAKFHINVLSSLLLSVKYDTKGQMIVWRKKLRFPFPFNQVVL